MESKTSESPEKREIVFLSPVDPVSGDTADSELFEYKGILLGWGVKTEYDELSRAVLTNTVAIVESQLMNSNGRYPVLLLSPEEIELI